MPAMFLTHGCVAKKTSVKWMRAGALHQNMMRQVKITFLKCSSDIEKEGYISLSSKESPCLKIH